MNLVSQLENHSPGGAHEARRLRECQIKIHTENEDLRLACAGLSDDVGRERVISSGSDCDSIKIGSCNFQRAQRLGLLGEMGIRWEVLTSLRGSGSSNDGGSKSTRSCATWSISSQNVFCTAV